MGRVMVAVDDSPQSQEALKWASKTFLKKGDELHIVSVLAPSSQVASDDVTDPSRPYLDASAEAKQRRQKTLDNYSKIAKDAGVKNVKAYELQAEVGGQAAVGQALSQYASANKVDSAVLGSRGLGSFSKNVLGALGLGSVSTYAASHLPCPVVIHRAGHGEE